MSACSAVLDQQPPYRFRSAKAGRSEPCSRVLDTGRPAGDVLGAVLGVADISDALNADLKQRELADDRPPAKVSHGGGSVPALNLVIGLRPHRTAQNFLYPQRDQPL